MAKRRTKKEGSIWRDKNKWRAAVIVDGKRLSRNFDTKIECSAWIKEAQSQIERGMTYQKANVTLGDFIQQWLEIHKTTLAPKTALQYEQLVQNYIVPQVGKIKLRELRLDRVEAHYVTLQKNGLSSRSVRFVHAILHKSLNDAIRRGYVGYNAAQGAILPRSELKEMVFLDTDEVLQFLITVQESPYNALYTLAIKTGMRKGELLALKWSDLNWQSGTILVQRQVQRIKGQGLVFRPPKTRAGRRTIQLGEKTLETLRKQLARCKLLESVTGDNWKDLNLIFPSTVGTPLGGSNISRDFRKQLEKASVKNIRFHDLRHTAASLMLNNGVPVLVVSKILGHSKTSTTLDIYGHLIPTMQENAARIMDEIVTPIPVNFGELLETKTPD
jgi:integrase